MIVSFANAGAEDIFTGVTTRRARQCCPQTLWKIARRKLDQLDSVVMLDELRVPPGNRLENLAGDRSGQYSVRINQQYRICFVWTAAGPEQVELIDYH